MQNAFFILLSLSLAAQCLAADEPSPVLARADDGSVSLEGEIPFELDPLSVTTEPMPVGQEAAYRLMRQALERKRSNRLENIDELVCWFEKPTGTRMEYLFCGRNGDIWTREPDPYFSRDLRLKRQVPGYGKLIVSSQPMSKRKMAGILSSLHGSAELDYEWTSLALNGQNPPRDIPDAEEMDRFAQAFYAVETLSETGADDDELEAAIEAEGLSLKRYNRLIHLLEIFQSLENQMVELVDSLRASAEETKKTVGSE
jgi:hypothetical protein